MTLHKITSDMLPENTDKWGRELSEQIEMQMLLMNIYLMGLDQQEINLEGKMDFAGIPRLKNTSSKDRKILLKQITIINTFLSLFRGVVVFIDKSLSIHFKCIESQKNPIGPIDDIETFIEKFPNEVYKKFTRDLNQTFPKKIEMIPTLNERSRDKLIAYNKIRIAFEHHGGIAKSKILLPLSKLERSNEEKGMQKVNIRLDQLDIKEFKKDELIKLKSQDVSVIAIDIKGWIIKDILVALDAMDKL